MSFIKSGVIGHPIAHSKSPLIHNYWMDVYNCEGSYEAIDITPENLAAELKRLIDEGYAGFNVTVPHKEAVMTLCDEVDDLARAVGAVNTVVIEDGRMLGTNTDVSGFVQNLRNASRNFGYSWGIENGPVLILGAGGAARAAVYGLLKDGAPEIIIANRTRAKAEEFIKFDPSVIRVIDWEERSEALAQANLVVNTTALGMGGKGDLEMDFSLANPDILVHDIVYNPLYTGFLKDARDHDLRVLSGIGMLLFQAQPAFEAWFDVHPEVTQTLEDLVLGA